MRHKFVQDLIRDVDFLGLQETHCTSGRIAAFRGFEGTSAFWSHLSRSRAGIGLIVQTRFLELFTSWQWEEDQAGRLAVLQLRGPSGGMDIWVCYFSANSREEREESIRKISRKISAAEQVMSFIFGDFNFTEHECDRFQKQSGQWSGQTNKPETRLWRDLCGRGGFAEWAQEHMTCDTGIVQSRIDRAYCNQHLAEQLNKHLSCVALPWVSGLSAHRPLRFSRTV